MRCESFGFFSAHSFFLCFGSQVARHLGVDTQSGLSLLEVSVRQGLVPPNELEQEEEVSERSSLVSEISRSRVLQTAHAMPAAVIAVVDL